MRDKTLTIFAIVTTGLLYALFMALICKRVKMIAGDNTEARRDSFKLVSLNCDSQKQYGRYTLFEVTSLYAKDGDRWLPVYAVTEVTTNYPPCRNIDRTGMWYTPVGGVDVKKLREEYTPPKPLWEEE